MPPRGRARAARRPADVRISEVQTAKDLDAFVQFQLDLYSEDPNYVPPIIAERRDFLTPGKNPFLDHAELRLFLAHRENRIVGRVAAIVDTAYNQFHDTEIGFFGMFDCVDDAGVAGLLLEAAEGFVKKRGLKSLLGPTNLSTNHDCGVLVDGFGQPPTMMMPYNFRYYPRLLLANGFVKAKDLYAYELSTSVAPPEKLVKAAEKALSLGDLTVRPIDLNDLSNEKRRIQSVYDAVLEQIWGFVPLTPDELDAFAKRLKPLVMMRPELVLLAFVGDEPVGFSLTLADSNVALKAAQGHLTKFGVPIGLAKMFWASRRIDRVRVLTAAVKPAWRRKGIDSALYLETLRQARKLGFSGGEAGWVLEDDEPLNATLRQLGRRSKTLRLYERKLVPSPAATRSRRRQSRAD